MFRVISLKTPLFVRASSLLALVAAFSLGVAPAHATTIPVPDGDFSSAASYGSIGGGLLNPSGSAVIGSGPWTGTYSGALGVLAPPTLTINSTGATISGIAGINALGIVDNGGSFSQTLSGQTYAANTTYTLTADVNASTPLGAALLQSSGVGIALTANGTVVSSTTSTPGIVSLLSGTNYQVQLTFQTGASAPSGNIGIQLFDQPGGLLTANLLSSVTFSNVTLNATTVPEPTSFGLLGIGLSTLGWARFRKRRQAAAA